MASKCEHGRNKSRCKDCGGKSICPHGRLKYVCKVCAGSLICEHNRQKYSCKLCCGAAFCPPTCPNAGRLKARCTHGCGRGRLVCTRCQRRTTNKSWSVCKECLSSDGAPDAAQPTPLAQLHADHAALRAEHTALQRAYDFSQQENGRLCAELALLRTELAQLRAAQPGGSLP